MKILAVIPARAGSKGIPNKNIRIVRDHPLIFYTINNAVSSKLITEVIVSTDSPEVKIIAQQMGVNVHWRDKELCGDKVTLDAVVFDAVSDKESWDYIVTMQPTSPTLRVETLDNALKYAIDNHLDTLISAINKPHLSWGVKNGKKVPNYEKRLNRQYLPPCYMETGAFVISKSSVVTSETRIGTNVDVYEIPEDESQDIDTFEDLKSVEATLNRQKVAIYVNGNNKRGIGHIYRALEIADEFYVKPDIYYDINQTDPKVFGRTTHSLIPVNGIAELFEICKRERYSIFINDILTTTIDYMIGLRSVLPDAKIINFEDDGEGVLKADLVFNALYEEDGLPHIYSGEKYYICGKMFMYFNPIKIKDQVEKVFISFGGADPQNYADRLLEIVSKPEYSNYHFIVVLGRAKNNVDELMKYNEYQNIEVLFDVTNMPELMTQCDIAVTSCGRTSHELALLGIPTIAVSENAREEKHGFVNNDNGFSYIGTNPATEVIEGNLQMYLKMSKETRYNFQKLLLSHDLHGGRKRVMNLINGL